MYVLGKYTTTLWARLLIIPNRVLAPLVLVAALIGAYATRGMFFDVWVAIGFGIIGFFANKLDFSVSNFILAFVLAQLLEGSFRRSLMISHGNYDIFINRPFCIVMLVLIFLLVAGKGYGMVRKAMRKQNGSGGAA